MASRLQDVILRTDTASKPAATDVPPGTIHWDTDLFELTRSNGTDWESISLSSGGVITFTNAGIHIQDTDASHDLIVKGGSNLSADRTLTITTGDSDQTLVITSNNHKKVVGLVIDGGGSTITTGVKGYIRVPWACTITKATLLADIAGSIVIDIWKDTFANHPPTIADTITASAKPTLNSVIAAEDSTLSGWTTSISAGDVLGFNVDSATTVTRVILELEVSLV